MAIIGNIPHFQTYPYIIHTSQGSCENPGDSDQPRPFLGSCRATSGPDRPSARRPGRPVKPGWFPHDSHPTHGFSMIFHIWSLVEVGISRLDVILWYSMQFHITCIWCPFFWYIQCHRFNWACGKLLVATSQASEASTRAESGFQGLQVLALY